MAAWGKTVYWVVPALALSMAVGSARADPAPMGTGGLPVPLDEVQVRIAREDLVIRVGLKKMRVQADLWLENHGQAGEIRAAFPCAKRREYGYGVVGPYCKSEFQVQVEGETVEVSKAKAGKLGRAWQWAIPLSGTGRVLVSIRYTVEIKNPNYSLPLGGAAAIYYQLTTGARWAGKIGELNMKVHLPVDAVVHIVPTGYERRVGEITWKLTDHEPAQDLVVVLHSPTTNSILNECRFGLPKDKGGGNCAKPRSRKQLMEVIRRLERHSYPLDWISGARSLLPRKHRFKLPSWDQAKKTYERSAELLREMSERSAAAEVPRTTKEKKKVTTSGTGSGK